MGKKQIVDLVQRAQKTNERLEGNNTSLLNIIDRVAMNYSGRSSEFLSGVIGGGIGYIVATGLHLVGAAAVLSTPLGVIMGIAGAILIWRGKGANRFERDLKKHRMVLQSYKEELKSLPPGTPADVKKELWQDYLEANRAYGRLLLDGSKGRKTLNPPALEKLGTVQEPLPVAEPAAF